MDEGSDKKKGKGEGRVEKEKVPFKDDFFREFQRVCNNVANVDAYTDKTAIIKRMFTRGAQGGECIMIIEPRMCVITRLITKEFNSSFELISSCDLK